MAVTPIRLHQGTAPYRAYVILPWLLLAAAILYVPFATDFGWAPGSIDKATRINQLNQVIAYAVAILGLDLVVGYSGQLSLGQSAFIGTGAYTTMILVTDHYWSYLATLPVSAAVCFCAGLLVGIPATRVKGVYLAVLTLVIASVFPSLVLRFGWLTGGTNGKGPPRTRGKLVPPSWMPFADDGRLAGPLWVYTLSMSVAVILFVLARNFVKSRTGRALRAVRDNEPGATSMGVIAAQYRALSFGASAMYGGLAGSLLMFTRPFASEVQFGPQVAIFLIVGLVIGGVGTMSGAPVGAFVYFFVPYYMSEWTYDQSGIPPGLRQLTSPLWAALEPAGGAAAGIVFGLAVILLMFVLPSGFIGGMRALRARVITVVPHPRWLADTAQGDRRTDPRSAADGAADTLRDSVGDPSQP